MELCFLDKCGKTKRTERRGRHAAWGQVPTALITVTQNSEVTAEGRSGGHAPLPHLHAPSFSQFSPTWWEAADVVSGGGPRQGLCLRAKPDLLCLSLDGTRFLALPAVQCL